MGFIGCWKSLNAHTGIQLSRTETMWSTKAMLVFIFYVLFNNLNNIQYVECAAAVSPPPPQVAPVAPIPGFQPGVPYNPANAQDVSSKLIAAIRDAIRSAYHYKKESLYTIAGVVANSLQNNTGTPGTQQPVPGTPSPPVAPAPAPETPVPSPPVSPAPEPTPPATAPGTPPAPVPGTPAP